jgi:hypothetical protein
MQTHSSVARRSLVLPLILIASTLLSCEDDPTRPSTSDFALTVTVTEPDGTPVPGLDVVVWNISRQLITFLQDDFFGRRAVTTLRFELAAPGRCWLTVTDVAGRVVQTIFAGEELPAGTHQVLFGPEIDYIAGVAVFAAELVVHDLEPDVERFRQSRWMTMVELDRQRLTLPRTDAEGRVVLRDPRYAPGLVVTEAMPAIDENGDHMGSFVIGDSMVVRAYDADGKWVQAWTEVDAGANAIALRWDAPLRGIASGSDFLSLERARAMSSIAPAGPSRVFPATDLLYQNAPNPFN